MSSDDTSYSIKEFIADKFDNPETGVFVRLDRIDTKQAIANGRTSKIEAKQKGYIMVISVVWAITLAIGGLFARLYVADIARAVAEEQKSDIIKEVNIETEKTIVEILKNYQ
jgi:hypothetical protein